MDRRDVYLFLVLMLSIVTLISLSKGIYGTIWPGFPIGIAWAAFVVWKFRD